MDAIPSLRLLIGSNNQGGVDATLCHTRSKESFSSINNKAFEMFHVLLRVK
jgi:hypothetical protein